MTKICEQCGKEFEAREHFHRKCQDCFRGGSQASRGRTAPAQRSVPAECTFTTFYGEDGYLKREIYLESAEKMTGILESNDMTMNQIRNLFHMLKSASNVLKADPNADFGEARQTFYEFVRQVDYQHKRKHIPDVFVKFVKDHVDVATKSAKEFDGFVQYLTSILARIKQK
jgi:CRISPR/Cas system CSM-associated protein Csm2 small subunit